MKPAHAMVVYNFRERLCFTFAFAVRFAEIFAANALEINVLLLIKPRARENNMHSGRNNVPNLRVYYYCHSSFFFRVNLVYNIYVYVKLGALLKTCKRRDSIGRTRRP